MKIVNLYLLILGFWILAEAGPSSGKILRTVQTQAIIFLKSMSERVGSDIERL